MSEEPEPPRRRWAIAMGLLFLHVLAVGRYQWEDAAAVDWLRISPDLALLLAAGFSLVLWVGYRAAIGHLIALGVLLVPMYRFGHTFVRLYQREFDPWNDVLLLPSLVHLLTHEMTGTERILAYVAAGAAAVAIYVAAYFSVRAVLRVRRRPTAVAGLCASLLILTACLAESLLRPAAPSSFMAPGMYVEIARDARDTWRNWGYARRLEERIAEAHRLRSEVGSDLSRLQKADVFVLFMESYGRALFRDARTEAVHAGWRAELEPELRAAGFRVVSRFCFPSIVGGLSSAAHAELLTGVGVPNRRLIDQLLQSDLEALPRYFNQAGYYTLQVQPATTGQWPQGKFFGFQEDVFADSLPYRGYHYHWGRMPDQFALDHVLRTRIRPSRRPVFLQYVSVSSHAPYRAVPPYYPDWSRVAEDGAYLAPARTYPIGWTDFVDHPLRTEAYMDCLHYSLRTVVGFVTRLERPSLVLVLGDHQPPAMGYVEGASRDVPMHVISNREDLLLPFAAQGFVEGLRPPDDVRPFPTAGFVYAFLGAFSTPRPEGR